MFTVLNRLRGTYGYFSHVTGIIISILFYSFTHDIYTAIALYPMYVLGESFGWGKWIGGIRYKETTPISIQQEDEGVNNGVHWLANSITPQDENFYDYSIVALALRGMLWVFLVLLPLVVGGYISVFTLLSTSIITGIGFPISIKMGMSTTKKFNFPYMNGFWEHAEVWYGLIQDILAILIIIILV